MAPMHRTGGAEMLIVVAGVIARDGRVLLSRRDRSTHLAGHWELPGGKMEPGESPEGALRRELKEELDVTASIGPPFAFNHHDYGTRRVLLLTYRVEIEGSPRPLGCAELGWFAPDEIGALETPAADAPIFDRLRPLLREQSRTSRR